MFRRRRPLLRAAVIGGGAYVAGKKSAQRSAEQAQEQQQMKRQEAESQVILTGNDNLDKAQQQLAKLVGPNRITAELSMAKLDRAVYTNRQLEAVMEDFWFNHFNVFENKGADRWMLTAYVRDSIRPHTMGKFQDLLLATAKSPAMLFFLDNWLSADPLASKQYQQDAEENNVTQSQTKAQSARPAQSFSRCDHVTCSTAVSTAFSGVSSM